MRKIMAAAMLLLGCSLPAVSSAAEMNLSVPVSSYVALLPQEEISEEELNSLILMREEEKLARDVYLTLSQQYRIPIFRNIAKSEQRHMDAIKVLLDKYGIEDPVKDDSVGVFTNPELQNLYHQLVEKGSESLVEALKVGATIEDLDIKDLEEALEKVDNEDIRIVYSNLMKGSRNHLRAFTRILSRLGVTYEPQYISPEEYQEIISSPHEAGFVR